MTWEVITYQNTQVWLDTRVAIAIWVGSLITAVHSTILAKNIQKRNERLLTYQFKLQILDKKRDKIVEGINTSEDLVGLASWIHLTDPKYNIDKLISMFKNKEDYIKTYDKMKKEFSLDDI